MFGFVKIVLGVFLVLCFVSNVFSIKCWSCNSNDDPKCGDPFDNATIPITNCYIDNGRRPICRKLRQNLDGEWRYFRNCGHMDMDKIYDDKTLCLKQTETNGSIVEDCSCLDRDGCNSSGIISPIPFMMLASVFLVYY